MKLTQKRILKLTKPGRFGDGHGLILQVTEAGTKSWLFRYQHRGKERWMGLGPLIDVSLDDAREAAHKSRLLIRDGIDPIKARRADRAAKALEAAKAITFEDAARQYFAAHERRWKNDKHRAQFLSTLRQYAFDKIGRLPVSSVDTGLVLKVVEPIWNTKTETANRVRGRIESVLDWATVRGYRTGDNPARWKGHLSEVLPSRGAIQKVEHHAALPFADLPVFIVALAEREGTAARALEFTILTAARTGETIGATWAEIDLKERLWVVPAGRIKGGKEHRVPLTDRAVGLLEALPREKENPFVFIGPKRGGGLSNMAMAAVISRMERGDVTVHGFRSCFRDWAAERSAFPNFVVEMALAHSVGNAVEAAYRRGDLLDKRRKLMDAWARYATSAPTTDNVVEMKRAVNE